MASVLIVDDSTIIRRVLRNFINNYFHDDVTIEEAENGQIALDMIANEDFDIMFLDCNMPVMNGMEVVKSVRADKNLNKLKIIMATTEGKQEIIQELIKNGINGFVVKPLQEDKIVKTLNRVAGRLRK